jgi:hypothetical protein
VQESPTIEKNRAGNVTPRSCETACSRIRKPRRNVRRNATGPQVVRR